MENIINLKLLKLSSGKKEDEVTKSITSPKTVSSEENKSEVLFELGEKVFSNEAVELQGNTELKMINKLEKKNNKIENENELAIADTNINQTVVENNKILNTSNNIDDKSNNIDDKSNNIDDKSNNIDGKSNNIDDKSSVLLNSNKKQLNDKNNLFVNSKLPNKKTKKVKLTPNKIEKTNQNILNTVNLNDLHVRKNIKKTLNNFTPDIQKETKVKIKSFFKNYLNYVKKRKNLGQAKYEKNNSFNKMTININSENKKNINLDNINLEISNIENKNQNKTPDTTIKESNLFSQKININDKNEKVVYSNKDNEINNFDRLKNILDITSSDVNERLSNIFEKNLKLQNNKFEIQLRPENLGRVQVTLEISGENVDININSDNINTIQSLIENNSNLQKMFQSQGLNLNNFSLNSGNYGKNKNKDNNVKNIEREKKVANVNNDEGIIENKKIKDNIVFVNA